jgi:hypothetical protein
MGVMRGCLERMRRGRRADGLLKEEQAGFPCRAADSRNPGGSEVEVGAWLMGVLCGIGIPIMGHR